MVAIDQEKVREKINFSRSGKSQGILISFREFCDYWKSQGKVSEFCRTVHVTHDT